MIKRWAKIAYEKGYRVIDGKVIGPRGKALSLHLKSGRNNYTYPYFTVHYEGRTVKVPAHQLAAWQKYDKKCIGRSVEVRHLNDNALDFSENNIALGNRSQNMKDAYRNGYRRQPVGKNAVLCTPKKKGKK